MTTSDARDVVQWCRLLAACSEEPGRTTRTFLSQPMHDVHARLGVWMTECGMTVHVDAAGNLRGVYEAVRPGAPRLYVGSHLDTVPNAGAFDGILGVVLGIALVRRLERRRLPFSIEVIGFSEEEGVRFGVPFIGSRAFIGTLDRGVLARTDPNGVCVDEAIRHFGLDPDRLRETSVVKPAIGFLEIHIEQGPVLDRLDVPVAVVDAIAGQTRLDVTFTGAANHAGTTPMAGRRDAVAGAAAWILEVEALAAATNGLVATVGRVQALPGATNVIAGEFRASLDVRHANDPVRAHAMADLVSSAETIATARGLSVQTAVRLDQAAVAMDNGLQRTLLRAAERIGVSPHVMPSGAGHDAMIVAAELPVAMLFVRTPGGISHHPDESVREDDVAVALDVAFAFLEELGGEGGA